MSDDNYVTGPAEVVGDITPRLDMEVPPDTSHRGWYIETRYPPIFRADDFEEKRPFQLGDLHVDDEIVVMTLFGYAKVKVFEVDTEKKTARAENGGYLAFLEYDVDHSCWTTHGGANLKAIQRLSLPKSES